MSGPYEIIVKINNNDVVCGRKGVALNHPGNVAYRKIVGMNKELYATCIKNEKLRYSKSIVAAIREIGGQFLERVDGKTSSSLDEKDEDGNPVAYRDIGDKRAIEKTSQALREGQSKLLKKLAQKQAVSAISLSQAHPYMDTNLATTTTSSATLATVTSHLNPFAAQHTPLHQATTPMPSDLLLHLLSQSEIDSLYLALLRRLRHGR